MHDRGNRGDERHTRTEGLRTQQPNKEETMLAVDTYMWLSMNRHDHQHEDRVLYRDDGIFNDLYFETEPDGVTMLDAEDDEQE
jgi:hypothetical protein